LIYQVVKSDRGPRIFNVIVISAIRVAAAIDPRGGTAMSGTWRCVGAVMLAGIALLGLVGGLEIAAGRLRVDLSSTFVASRTSDVTDLAQDFLNLRQESRQSSESSPIEGGRIREAREMARGDSQVEDAR
jgi:hypothetical protein